MNLIFEQQPKESAKAFAAFSLYRDMGPERSLAAVAVKLGKSKTTVAVWSRRHHWQARLAPQSEPVASPHLQPSPLQWEQQPGETGKNFAAFTTYLALGPARSLSKAARAVGCSKDQLARWSQRWHWPQRAAAYHAHLAAVERKATEDIVASKGRDWAAMHETIRRQAWSEAEDLIALAQEFKTRWRDSDRLPDFAALIRALELAFKLKQFAAGMPSEIKAVNTTVSGPGGGPVRVELEAALNKIYGDPAPGEVLEIESATPALSEGTDAPPALPQSQIANHKS